MSNNQLTLLAAGDIMMGDHPICTGRGVNALIEKKGSAFLFQYVKETLRAGDIVFGNLETVISNKNYKKYNLKSYQLRAMPQSANALKDAGFNVLSIANNHILEHGEEAFYDTLRILEENKINYTGKCEKGKQTPALISQNDVIVGFLGYSLIEDPNYIPLYAKSDIEAIIDDVIALKKKVDIPVVSLHWGYEHIKRPSPGQIDTGRKIIDAGAKLIIGHHSHCLQGMEYYKDGVILYSLGNFVFDMWQKKARESMIFKCSLSKQGIEDAEIIPVFINDSYQPEILKGTERERFLEDYNKLNSEISGQKCFKEYDKEAGKANNIYRKEVSKYFLRNFFRYPPWASSQMVISRLMKIIGK